MLYLRVRSSRYVLEHFPEVGRTCTSTLHAQVTMPALEAGSRARARSTPGHEHLVLTPLTVETLTPLVKAGVKQELSRELSRS